MQFLVFGLFLIFGVAALVIFPIMAFPGLDARKKIILSLVCFVVLVVGGMGLYLLLGVPQLSSV